MGRFESATSPWELIAWDLIGPLPITDNGNRYILTGLDLFSKHAYGVPLETKAAEVVTAKIKNILLQNPKMPRAILTDNGTEFFGLAQLCTQYNMQHKLSVPYHPQTNGACERMNQTIKNRLFCEGDNDTWDDRIDEMIHSINCSPNWVTKFSPFEIETGHPGRNINDFIEHDNQERMIKRANEAALARIEDEKSRRITKFANENFVPYALGDMVLAKNMVDKFPRFLGPFKIIEVRAKGLSYEIQNLDTGRTYRRCVSQLKPYVERIASENNTQPPENNAQPPETNSAPIEEPTRRIMTDLQSSKQKAQWTAFTIPIRRSARIQEQSKATEANHVEIGQEPLNPRSDKPSTTNSNTSRRILRSETQKVNEMQTTDRKNASLHTVQTPKIDDGPSKSKDRTTDRGQPQIAEQSSEHTATHLIQPDNLSRETAPQIQTTGRVGSKCRLQAAQTPEVSFRTKIQTTDREESQTAENPSEPTTSNLIQPDGIGSEASSQMQTTDRTEPDIVLQRPEGTTSQLPQTDNVSRETIESSISNDVEHEEFHTPTNQLNSLDQNNEVQAILLVELSQSQVVAIAENNGIECHGSLHEKKLQIDDYFRENHPFHPRNHNGVLMFPTNFPVRREKDLNQFKKPELWALLGRFNIPAPKPHFRLTTKDMLRSYLIKKIKEKFPNHPVTSDGTLLFLPNDDLTRTS